MNISTPASDDTRLSIAHNNESRIITYDELVQFHRGDAWFGCVLGFRLLTLAARELSPDSAWSVDRLSIVSGHPGPGVRDAIELVTGCVTSGRYTLLPDITNQGCNRNMRYEWWISSNDRTLYIKLHDDIVPELFFALLDRAGTEQELPDDKQTLDRLKAELSNTLWTRSLDAAFEYRFVATASFTGELRHA